MLCSTLGLLRHKLCAKTYKLSIYTCLSLITIFALVNPIARANALLSIDDHDHIASTSLNNAYLTTSEAHKANFNHSNTNNNAMLDVKVDFETQKQIELITSYIVRNLIKFSCEIENKGCNRLAKAEQRLKSIENVAKSLQSQGFSLDDKDYETLAALNGENSSLKERIDSIYIGPLNIKGYDQFAIHHLIPFSFGQQYIGKINAKEYEMAWRRYVDQVNNEDGHGYEPKCYLSAAGSNLSVFGPHCLPFDGLERVEAHVDDAGNLVAVSIFAGLKGDMNIETFLKFLDSRYLAIIPNKHNLKELSELNTDLSSLMYIMSKGKYTNDVYWYSYGNDKYIKASFSSYNDKKNLSLLFAKHDYFIETEKLSTLRRLAILRQELDRDGLVKFSEQDKLNFQEKLKNLNNEQTNDLKP